MGEVCVGKSRYRVRPRGRWWVACIMRVSYWLAFGYSTGRLEFSQGSSKVALAGECRGRRNTEEPAKTAGVSCRHNIIQAGHCWLDLPYWTPIPVHEQMDGLTGEMNLHVYNRQACLPDCSGSGIREDVEAISAEFTLRHTTTTASHSTAHCLQWGACGEVMWGWVKL